MQLLRHTRGNRKLFIAISAPLNSLVILWKSSQGSLYHNQRCSRGGSRPAATAELHDSREVPNMENGENV